MNINEVRDLLGRESGTVQEGTKGFVQAHSYSAYKLFMLKAGLDHSVWHYISDPYRLMGYTRGFVVLQIDGAHRHKAFTRICEVLAVREFKVIQVSW